MSGTPTRPARLRSLVRREPEPDGLVLLRREYEAKNRRLAETILNLDNLISPVDWLDAGDGFPGFGSWRWNRPASRTQDRSHAPLNYLNEEEWRQHIALARDLCQRNHLALGFRDHVSAFIGSVSVSFVLRGQDPGATSTGPAGDGGQVDPLVRAATSAWEEWRELMEWGEGEEDREEECRRRLIVEGETTLRFFVGDDSTNRLPYARHVEPELIRTPPGFSTLDPAGWGVLSAERDDECERGLWVCQPANTSLGQWIDENEYVRLKGNTDRTVKRGFSDFFPVGEHLRKVLGLLDNMGHVARLQAAIAWWEQYPTATPDQIQTMIDQGADYSRPKGAPGGAGRTTDVQNFEPGSIPRTEGGRQVLPGPTSEPTGFLAIEAAILRAVGFRFGCPSYFSGEGDASFASVLVTGSPFVRIITNRQKKLKGFAKKVAIRFLEFCEKSGRLPRGTAQRLRVMVTAEPVVMADEEKQARTFLSLYEKNCADPIEYMKGKGLDPKVVAANIQEWQKKFPAAASAALPGPTNVPPGPTDPDATPPGSAGGDGTSPNPTDIFGESVEETPGDVIDDVVGSALEALGVLPPAQESIVSEKNGRPPHPGLVFDTTSRRWKRPNTAAKGKTVAARAMPVKGKARSKAALKSLPQAKTPAPAPTKQRVAAAKKAIASIPPEKAKGILGRLTDRAKSAVGRFVMGRVDRWADGAAEKYAPRVAKRLGLDNKATRYVLGVTIKWLCRRAGRAAVQQVAKRIGGKKESIFSDSIYGPALETLVNDAVARVLERGGFTGVDSHGHHWQNGKQVKKNPDGASSDRTGGQGGNTTELHPDDKAAIEKGIDADVAALPEAQRPPATLIAKAKDLAVTAVAHVLIWGTRLSPAAQKVGGILSDIFDVPSDMAKFAYNPSLGPTLDNPNPMAGRNDFVKSQLADTLGMGISGHMVASIASKVLVKAAFYAAGKIRGKSEAVEGDGVKEWADMIAQLYAHIAKGLGVEGGNLPTAEAIERGLRVLLSNGETGS